MLLRFVADSGLLAAAAAVVMLAGRWGVVLACMSLLFLRVISKHRPSTASLFNPKDHITK
jgi:hypothetical protein